MTKSELIEIERPWFIKCVKASSLISQRDKIKMIKYLRSDDWPGYNTSHADGTYDSVRIGRNTFTSRFLWDHTGNKILFINIHELLVREFGNMYDYDRINKIYFTNILTRGNITLLLGSTLFVASSMIIQKTLFSRIDLSLYICITSILFFTLILIPSYMHPMRKKIFGLVAKSFIN